MLYLELHSIIATRTAERKNLEVRSGLTAQFGTLQLPSGPLHCHRDDQFYRAYQLFLPRFSLPSLEKERLYLYIVMILDPTPHQQYNYVYLIHNFFPMHIT